VEVALIVLGAALALAGSIIAARIELLRARRLRVLDELIPRLNSPQRLEVLDALRRTCALLSAPERRLVDKLQQLQADIKRVSEEQDEALGGKTYDEEYKKLLDEGDSRRAQIAANFLEVAGELELEVISRLKRWRRR
jgi:hypothetical protein